jgi:hypothetical protein
MPNSSRIRCTVLIDAMEVTGVRIQAVDISSAHVRSMTFTVASLSSSLGWTVWYNHADFRARIIKL